MLYHVGPMPIAGFDRELFHKGPSSVYWLPIKMVGLHYAFNDPLLRTVVAFTMMSVGKHVRAKLRLHDGKKTLFICSRRGYVPSTRLSSVSEWLFTS